MVKKRPRPLRRGDRVAVVAPSGPVDPNRLKRGLRALRRMGLHVLEAPHLYDRWGFLAGRDEDRAEALREMFCREDVTGIFCARGGYGAGRILPHLDFGLIRRHPKVFLGSSDVTILHLALTQHAGLVTFHGPMVEPDFSRRGNPLTRRSLRALILDGTAFAGTVGGRFLSRQKRIAGELTGGNLSLVTWSLGTPFAIETKGKVLFLEEVNEEPYRIDRMLTHLRLAGKLEGVKGIIFGQMVACAPRKPLTSFSVADILARCADEADLPCFATFPSGHGRENVVLPMGGRIILEGQGKRSARFRIWT
ncbi:MAG: LD-carboxypeptidase [Candidatus Methylomirabilales bacterium]